MPVKHLVLGFFARTVMGFDDAITHIPVLAGVTRTRRGKIVFLLGTLCAVMIVVLLALFFSTILHNIPYYKYIMAGLLLVLAVAIYFDFFVHEKRKKEEKRAKLVKLSSRHLGKIFGIGFTLSFATAIDDVVAYIPLFANGTVPKIMAVIGIFIASIVQLIVIFYFSKALHKVKYKEEITSAGLVVIAFLILFGIL